MVDRRWLLRLALVLAVFVNNANFSAATVALPSIRHSLGLGFSGLQWTMTSYLLAYSAGMLPAGRLSDAIGVRAVRHDHKRLRGAGPAEISDPFGLSPS